MKVLLVSSLYPPHVVGGAERVVEQLARGLAARGHTALVITTAPDGVAGDSMHDGVGVKYVPVRNLYRPFDNRATPGTVSKSLFHAIDSANVVMAAEVARIGAAFKPDVINTHNLTGFSPAVFGALRRATRAPIAHTMHDGYLLCPRTTLFRNGRNCSSPCADCRAYAVLRTWNARDIDLLIGVSRYILDRHLQHPRLRRLAGRVIYNGCRIPAVAAPARSGALKVGYLGQIRETKGVHILVDSFMRIASASAAELHIAGRGDEAYEAELRSRTGSEPRISWRGFVKGDEFLDEIDMLVVPSLWNDTAPLVVLEAMAHGVPLIGARRGGIPELLPKAASWTFEPDEPGSLDELLSQAIAAPDAVRALRSAARQHAEGFTMDRLLEEYIDTFATLRRST